MAKGKVISMFDSPEKAIRERARKLPIYKCLVSSDWEQSKIANVAVFRKHVNGNVTAGFYLVDLLCLGVKDSVYRFNEPEDSILEVLNSDPDTTFIEIDYALAHNIIYAGIEFAEEFELKPCKEFSITQYILEEDTDDIPLIEVVCGDNDMPVVFISNADPNLKLIAHMDALVGPEGFILVDLDEDEDDDEFIDEEDKFWEMIHKKYPGFKNVADWNNEDVNDYLLGKKKYPRFQDYQYIDALFIIKFPEFDFDDDKCPENELYNQLEINDVTTVDRFTENEEETAAYLRIKELEMQNSPKLLNEINTSLVKFPNSIMLEFSKLTFLTYDDKEVALEYNLALVKKFPNSILILSSAIGFAFTLDKYDIAERLIANKFHPHQHIPNVVFSSIEVSDFYSNIAYYLAYKGELLRADHFISLVEKSMHYHPFMSKDDNYIEAKEFILSKKTEKLFPEQTKEIQLEVNKNK